MNVRIIVDSSADILAGIREKILSVPVIVRFKDREFHDGVDLSYDELYKRMESGMVPQTSQANPASFEEVYQKVKDRDETAVVITISSKLSGVFQSATMALEGFRDRIRVVDSQNGSIGAGILAQFAYEKAKEGMDHEAIADLLEEEKKNVCLLGTLDSFRYLKRSGRISSITAAAGDVLSIKPILTLKGGAITSIGKVRGTLKSYKALGSEILKAGVDFSRPFCLAYAGNSDEHLRGFKDANPELALWDVARIGTAVGSYLGPGALLTAFFRRPSKA